MNRTALLEDHYRSIASRPKDPRDDTITTFNRDIFWYTASQHSASPTHTYEDTRKVIETAVIMFGCKTPHTIAVAILTHRFFKNYRATTFGTDGTFTSDYSFLIKKIGLLYNQSKGTMNPYSIKSKLSEYKEPTLVQINEIAGTVTTVKVPSDKYTLNEWAITYNKNCSSHIRYALAGLQL
jgi:hypothetical protein